MTDPFLKSKSQFSMPSTSSMNQSIDIKSPNSSLNNSSLNQSKVTSIGGLNQSRLSHIGFQDPPPMVSPRRKPRRSIKSMRLHLHTPLDETGVSTSSLANFQSPFHVRHSYESLQQEHVPIHPLRNWLDEIYHYLIPEISTVYYLFFFTVFVVVASYWFSVSILNFETVKDTAQEIHTMGTLGSASASSVASTTAPSIASITSYIEMPIEQVPGTDIESWGWLQWTRWRALRTMGRIVQWWANWLYNISVSSASSTAASG